MNSTRKYPYTFAVLAFSPDEWEHTDYYLEHGVGFCTDYADAANQIEDYYRDELVEIKNLKLYEENHIITAKREAIAAIADHLENFETVSIPCDEKGNEYGNRNTLPRI